MSFRGAAEESLRYCMNKICLSFRGEAEESLRYCVKKIILSFRGDAGESLRYCVNKICLSFRGDAGESLRYCTKKKLFCHSEAKPRNLPDSESSFAGAQDDRLNESGSNNK